MTPPSDSPKNSKCLFRLIAGLVLIISLTVIIFLSAPKVRHGTFLVAQKIPGAITYFFLNQYVPTRHFEKAVPWLDRQLKLANRFAPSQNTLLPDLIKNTKYVFERTRFPEEMAILLPFLERLVESFPEVFLARIWLGKTLAFSDPTSALEHLEEATKLLPIDDKPYRIALSIALREKLPERFQDWCGRFQKTQFGGHHYLAYNTLFGGLGLRAMALEVIDANGVREIVGNTGLQLGDHNNYDFPLEKPVNIHSMRLHLGVVPGVLVRVNQIQFYRGGKLTSSFTKEMALMSWSGYHLENGDILLTSLDGEIIDLYLPRKNLTEVDRIQINIRFERPGLGNPFPCGTPP